MKYKVDLFSAKSIKKLQKNLEEYRDGLDVKCKLIAEKLAEMGVQIAKVQVADLDAVFTGELVSSIHSEYGSGEEGRHIYYVVAGTDHAIFVEFGTGIIGKEEPYKGEFPDGVDWQYASGKTIRQLADGRYGWFYPGDDGNWYFTQGMPSRPFMYNTANEIREKILSVVKEVFK